MTKKRFPYFKGILVSICIVFLSVHSVQALLFLQDQSDISESYSAEQTTVITLLNDQPRSQNVLIQVAPNSQYLLSYLDIEDTTLTLIPGEKKNVLLNTQIPENVLSPETHVIDLIARSDDDKSIARTKIMFTIPGVAQPSLNIVSEEFSLEKEEKILSFEIENDGNVIMRPQPEIIVKKGNEIVKSIEYKTPIQIMPSRSYPLSMRLDTSSLEEGIYDVQVIFRDRNEIELQSSQESFEVKSVYEEEKNTTSLMYPLIIGGIFVVLVVALLGVNTLLKKREDPLARKIRTLEKREKEVEKELQRLINETHRSVNHANTWIKKHLGEEYELR